MDLEEYIEYLSNRYAVVMGVSVEEARRWVVHHLETGRLTFPKIDTVRRKAND